VDRDAVVSGDYVRFSQLAFLIVRDPLAAQVVAVDAVLAALRPTIAPDGPPAIQRARRKLVRESLISLRKRRLIDSLPWKGGRAPTPDLPDATAGLWRALGKLPPRQQVAVVLARFEGSTLAEISDALDCSSAAANSYLERAAKSLTRTLGEADLRQTLTKELRTVAQTFVREHRPDPSAAELAVRRAGRWRLWGFALGAAGVAAALALINLLRG
jgi:hypothetical protein